MEIPRICIDTDILIDHLRGKREIVSYIEKLEEAGSMLSTTSINAFELYYGAYKTRKREKNVAAVRNLLSRLILLNFNYEASVKAGEILAYIESRGRIIDYRDLFIGVTALVNGFTLLTRNVKHFKYIPGLKLLQAP